MNFETAFEYTNPDPKAYGLPESATEEQLTAARTQAAQNLLTGVAANEAYWNSRSELEALRAQHEGHGQIAVPPEQAAPTGEVASGTEAGTVEGTTVEEALPPAGTTAQVAPLPDNSAAAVQTLRKQLEAAGMTPEV